MNYSASWVCHLVFLMFIRLLGEEWPIHILQHVINALLVVQGGESIIPLPFHESEFRQSDVDFKGFYGGQNL